MPPLIPARSRALRGARPTRSDSREDPQMDLISIAVAFAFFAATLAAIELLERV
jgi:hypothetical protein